MILESIFESSASHSNVMHCSILFNNICLVNQRANTTISIQWALIFISAITFRLFWFFVLFQCFIVVFYYVSCYVVGGGVTEFNCMRVKDFAKVKTRLVYFASLLEMFLN